MIGICSKDCIVKIDLNKNIIKYDKSIIMREMRNFEHFWGDLYVMNSLLEKYR